jgi:hypothetical protein
MNSDRNFINFCNGLKKNINNVWHGHETDKIIEFMENWKYESPENLYLNESHLWTTTKMPKWLFFHCTLKSLKENKRQLYSLFYSWIYNKKNIYNIKEMLENILCNYFGCKKHISSLNNCMLFVDFEPDSEKIVKIKKVILFCYPDINNQFKRFILFYRGNLPNCLN